MILTLPARCLDVSERARRAVGRSILSLHACMEHIEEARHLLGMRVQGSGPELSGRSFRGFGFEAWGLGLRTQKIRV